MEILLILPISLAALLLLLALGLLLTHLTLSSRFRRGVYPSEPNAARFYPFYADRYPRRALSVFSGKNRLQGYLYGEEGTRGLLVFAHGIGTGHERYLREILWMVDHGWCVLAYDATGCCESEGKGTVSLVQSALDLNAVLTYVQGEPSLSLRPLFLMGHSWGGYAVVSVLALGHDVRAVASLAGYAAPLSMVGEFVRMHMGGAVRLLLPFVRLWLYLRHGRLSSLTAMQGIADGKTPVLLVHGTCDRIVPAESASIARAARDAGAKNVRIRLIDAEGQNGHNSIFYPAECAAYIARIDAEWEQLRAACGKEPAADTARAFWAQVDGELYNRPNGALLSEIDEFFREALTP